jgi:hypothetical protein
VSYQFILAEDVAKWLADKRVLKPSLEQQFAGLTPLGIAVVEGVLKAIKTQFDIQDCSYTRTVEDQGWHTISHTLLYANEPLSMLRQIAIDHVAEANGS